jgi:hypothetical protein
MGKVLLFPLSEPSGLRECTAVMLCTGVPWYEPAIERLKRELRPHYPASVVVHQMASHPLTIVIEGRIDRRMVVQAARTERILVVYATTDHPEKLFSAMSKEAHAAAGL